MQVVRKSLTLPKIKYLETHLNIVNSVLPDASTLTPKEVQVLARFMSFDGDLAQDRFGSTARKLVKAQMKLSDGGLGNYIKAFKDKNILSEMTSGDNKTLFIKPFIMPDPSSQEYQFKIVLESQLTTNA